MKFSLLIHKKVSRFSPLRNPAAILKLWSALACALACMTGSLRAEFLYVSNVNGGSISAYHIEKNGSLRMLAGSPFLAGAGPSAMAMDFWGRFAYVTNASGDNISAYRIAENGELKPVGGSPFQAGNEPIPEGVDFLGRFLYVANLLESTISGYHIGENGALTAVAGSPFSAQGSFNLSLAVDPFSRSVYVPNSQSGTISSYHIGLDGALRSVKGSPFPGGGNSVAVDLPGRLLYSLNADGISAYRIERDGALKPVDGSPFPVAAGAFSVTVDLLGRFVYVVNNSSGAVTINSVSAYRIEQNGSLTSVKGSPFQTGGIGPLLAAVDLFGRFLYVTNFQSSNVSAFRIQADGGLAPVVGSPFPTGLNPRGIAVSP
jgi:6-phosphogluconolactonase